MMMKWVVCVGMVVLLMGCNVETATKATMEAETTRILADKVEIRTAIRVYEVEMGEYPASLNDLVPDYLSSVPTRRDGSSFEYDPGTGQLQD